MTGRAERRSWAKAARRPPARTVQVEIKEGPFAGWAAEARADFPAGVLMDLAGGELGPIMEALDLIVIGHNMPNAKDQIATAIRDVDPYEGLLAIAGEIFDAIGKLPNR